MIWIAACGKSESKQECTTQYDTHSVGGSLSEMEGVDLLIVVDSSPGMHDWQRVLAPSIYSLVSAITDPDVGVEWPYPAVHDLRVGVVSADMGIDSTGEDGRPDGCSDTGDGARLLTQPSAAAVSLEQETMECSAIPDSWVEVGDLDSNPGIARDVACVAAIDADGCSVRQPLAAAVTALEKSDFIRPFALLAVVVVSSGDDCSVNDGDAFVDALQTGAQERVEAACAVNEGLLADTSSFWTRLVALKRGEAKAVLFSAIAGVPLDAVCQAPGNNIEDCLEHDAMDSAETTWVSGATAPVACERELAAADAGAPTTAVARPSLRLVDFVREFGANGYMLSICNEEWRFAVRDLVRVAAPSCSEHITKPLPWNEDEQIARCEMLVGYSSSDDGEETCPVGLNPAPTSLVAARDEEDGTNWGPHFFCAVPGLIAPIDCRDADSKYASDSEALGWYYCENRGEDFEAACQSGLDEDGDGLTDCDDPACVSCRSCGGDGQDCDSLFTYNARVTHQAKLAILGRRVEIICPRASPSSDAGCAEAD